MKWNKRFDYPESIRSLVNDQRHYDVGEEKLPSVTTILSATQSDEKKASLAKWRRNVGENKADSIMNEAANRGTIMRRILKAICWAKTMLILAIWGKRQASWPKRL